MGPPAADELDALVEPLVVVVPELVALVVVAPVVVAPMLEPSVPLLLLVFTVELEPCLLWESIDAFESATSTLPLVDVSVAGEPLPHAAADMQAATDIDAAIALHCPRLPTYTRGLFMPNLSISVLLEIIAASDGLTHAYVRSSERRRIEAGEYTDWPSKIYRFVSQSNDVRLFAFAHPYARDAF